MTGTFRPRALSVRPAAAVAHAAAHLPSEPPARLRFRDHGDPCCFHVDVHEPAHELPSRSFLFIARPEPGGSRLELFSTSSGPARTSVVLGAAGTLILAITLEFLYSPLGALPVLCFVLAIHVRGEPPDPTDEVFATVARIVEPLRRTDHPYRDDAPGSA